MVAESRQVAFTNRQWEAYQFLLTFHRQQRRVPTARELGQGLGVTTAESAKLINALRTKGVLERRHYDVLAVVPPSYLNDRLPEQAVVAFGSQDSRLGTLGAADHGTTDRSRTAVSKLIA